MGLFALTYCPLRARSKSRRRWEVLLMMRFALGVALCIPLFQAATAWGRVDSSEARLDEIRRKMEEGQRLFLAKDYEKAAKVFEQGYEHYPYSAFLFNAGVCYEKLGRPRSALVAFGRYLDKDPKAPDAPLVQERLARLEAALATSDPGGLAAQHPDAESEAGSMKSLVVIETEPRGAPVTIYQYTGSGTGVFSEDDADFTRVADRVSPVSLTLAVGRYHIVVSKFRDFNQSETDISVSPGHVHHFRARLSQGKFMGFLEVKANVVGADIYIDSGGANKKLWGRAPHNALIAPGVHQVLIEAPGFEASHHDVVIEAGGKQELTATLERVGFGVIRVDANVAEVLVSVDDKLVGSWRQGESALEIELPSGAHDLLVTGRGYKDLKKRIAVPRGQLVPMRANMVEKYPRGAAWTQAILSAGFLGAGIYLGVESDRLHRNLSEERALGNLHAHDPDLRKGFWFSIGANSAFLVSGVMAGLSAFNFIRDPYPDPVLYRGKTREFEHIRAAQTPHLHSEKQVNRASVIYTGLVAGAKSPHGLERAADHSKLQEVQP